ncbi:MAG: HlyD family efflux transporter periplasmic adaptor subunit, partial [Lachnospiraceae bacterium]|nr:HlyD family efflux transporter periplasmic adaptor subunit [Lachnospiraceae bacterium]
LEQNLTQAQINYDSQYLQAKVTLENTLAEAERAENEYETAIQKAESDYETVKDAWEDAADNLALFEAKVGDGYYHADGSGTIMSVMARANQYLSGNGTIFMYRNTEEITVTVSVDQADISSVQVGDSVYVQSSDYGTFSGSVTSVNPISLSSSRANVTYQVTVLLEGNTGKLPANETVTVIFGMGGAR